MPQSCYVMPAKSHRTFVIAALEKLGFHRREAEFCERNAASAARHGQHTHAAVKLFHLLDHVLSIAPVAAAAKTSAPEDPGAALCLLPHVVVPGAEFEVVRDSGSLQIWNAHKKIGPAVSYPAMDACVEMARHHGIGAVAVYEANHYLWGGDYALTGARSGVIAGTFCQSALAEVVPHGGLRPTLGTNPISIAFPGASIAQSPVLLDFATSAVSMGTIQRMYRLGQQLPEGAAFTAEGAPTRDPAQARLLRPFGEHKGSGLSLLIELFMACVGSSLPTLRCKTSMPLGERNTSGFFFFAVDICSLAGRDFAQHRSQQENIAAVLTDILTDNSAARCPGTSKADHCRLCEQHGGLLLPREDVEELRALASRLDLAFPAERMREVAI